MPIHPFHALPARRARPRGRTARPGAAALARILHLATSPAWIARSSAGRTRMPPADRTGVIPRLRTARCFGTARGRAAESARADLCVSSGEFRSLP